MSGTDQNRPNAERALHGAVRVDKDEEIPMIDKLDLGNDRVLALHVSATLAKVETSSVVNILRKHLETHPQSRLYIELENLTGFEPDAAWDDLKYDLKHARAIERLAVVGERQREEWLTRLAKPFLYWAEVKYFDEDHREDAMRWVGASDAAAAKYEH